MWVKCLCTILEPDLHLSVITKWVQWAVSVVVYTLTSSIFKYSSPSYQRSDHMLSSLTAKVLEYTTLRWRAANIQRKSASFKLDFWKPHVIDLPFWSVIYIPVIERAGSGSLQRYLASMISGNTLWTFFPCPNHLRCRRFIGRIRSHARVASQSFEHQWSMKLHTGSMKFHRKKSGFVASDMLIDAIRNDGPNPGEDCVRTEQWIYGAIIVSLAEPNSRL